MTSNKFNQLFGQPPRKKETKLTKFHMDLASSIQAVTEEIVIKLMKSLKSETGINNICLSGGVALNCVANGKLLKSKYLMDLDTARKWRCWFIFRRSISWLVYQ